MDRPIDVILESLKSHPSVLIIFSGMTLVLSLAVWVCVGINKQKTVERPDEAYYDSPQLSPLFGEYRGRPESFLSGSYSTGEEFQFISGDNYNSEGRVETRYTLAHRNSFRTTKV